MITTKRNFLLLALFASIGATRADQEFDIGDLPEPLKSMAIAEINYVKNEQSTDSVEISDFREPLRGLVESYIELLQKTKSATVTYAAPTNSPNKALGWKRVVGEIPPDLLDIARYMTDASYRARYKTMNTNPPKGILFEGPPGVGKTTLARALSEVVNCAFIETKATDFTSMMQAGGSENIKRTFKKARKAAQESETGFCILYIDEFEIFAKRDKEFANQETSNMVRALLAEMDGFTEDTGVIVIASTNDASDIDDAVLRPGRFDSILCIDLPNEATRLAILNHYAAQGTATTYEPAVNWENVAKCTNTFSPADLKEIIAKAGRIAVDDESATQVTAAHVLIAVRDVITQNAHRGFGDIPIRLAHVETYLNGGTDQVGFASIAGKLPRDIEELYKQISNPEPYEAMGIERPKGILMTGPPGVGKTALARALAEELNCEFISAAGSEFVDTFVGKGASNLRKLFTKAKRRAKNKLVVLFIDEFEAVGSARSGNSMDTESHRTVDELLTQMDGFASNKNILVIGATNFANLIDPALLRPGRFDKIVEIDLPEIDARKEILKKYLNNLALHSDVTLAELGRMTWGMSAVEIRDMVNNTRIVLLESGRTVANHADFTEGYDRTHLGRAKELKQNKKCLENTAYHEMGHAIVGMFSGNSYPIHKVTITPRSMGKGSGETFLGAAFYLPVEDVHQQTKAGYEAQVMGLLGGRIAEEITFGDVSSGAWNDFEKATGIVRAMVTRMGMSDKLGPITYNPKIYVYSPETLALIDNEIRDITNRLYAQAKTLLLEKQNLLKKLAEKLIEKETIYAKELYKIAGLPQPVIAVK